MFALEYDHNTFFPDGCAYYYNIGAIRLDLFASIGGISRPTLKKWYRRYLEVGIDGLNDQSKKPHVSPNQKLNSELIQLILELRNSRNLAARCIQNLIMKKLKRSL